MAMEWEYVRTGRKWQINRKLSCYYIDYQGKGKPELFQTVCSSQIVHSDRLYQQIFLHTVQKKIMSLRIKQEIHWQCLLRSGIRLFCESGSFPGAMFCPVSGWPSRLSNVSLSGQLRPPNRVPNCQWERSRDHVLQRTLQSVQWRSWLPETHTNVDKCQSVMCAHLSRFSTLSHCQSNFCALCNLTIISHDDGYGFQEDLVLLDLWPVGGQILLFETIRTVQTGVAHSKSQVCWHFSTTAVHTGNWRMKKKTLIVQKYLSISR